jgi:hypothetical protein
MFAGVRPAERYDSLACTVGGRGGGEGRGGAILVLTREREATETANDKHEAAVAIGVERLRAQR